MPKTLTIFICLFLSLLLAIALIWPKYQNFKTLQEKILEKRAELQYKEEYFSNLKEISEELKNYSDNLSKIDSILPSKPSLPALFDFLGKTSAQSGLILKSIGQVSSQPLEQKPEIKAHSLNLSLSGSYFSFKNFLSILEKSARFIETEAISLSGEAPTFNFDLKIKFYSY